MSDEGRADGREADLIDRLDRDSETLRMMSEAQSSTQERDRLQAKAEGVRLAASKAREYLAAPFVAVPEAGEREECAHCQREATGFARAANGKRLCHPDDGADCYHLVTVYGHPMPCGCVDSTASIPGASVHGQSAPAVPVGVQPEPAEERTWIYVDACGHGKHIHKQPGDCTCTCSVCILARRGLDRYGNPAVPVVHPEPGDRAEDERRQKWSAIFYSPVIDPKAWHEGSNRDEFLDVLLKQIDAEVAAAVAAVRADRDRLAGQVAAIRALHRPIHSESIVPHEFCSNCAENYPCSTIRALVVSSPTTRPTHPESTSPSRTALDPEAEK